MPLDLKPAHPCVLSSAEFRTCAKILAGSIGANPDKIAHTGNRVDFSPEPRNPEIVNDVRGLNCDQHVAADGNMNFIRRDRVT